MALVKLRDPVINRSTGAPITGSCLVTYRAGGNAPLYTSGGGNMANPTPITQGLMSAYVEEGSYNLQISGSGFTTFTQEFEAWRGDAPRRLDNIQSPTSSVSFNGQRAILLGTPTSDGDAATKSYVDTAIAAVTTAVGNAVPIGTIWNWAGNADPTDTRFIICDGRAISRTTYATLYTLLGTAFGTGGGTTTFNIPDLRGRTVVGAGTGVGLTARTRAQTGGEETHLNTAAESGLPAHAHTTQKNDYSAAGSAGVVTDGAAGGGYYPTVSVAGPLNATSAHNNMQPFTVLHRIIRIS